MDGRDLGTKKTKRMKTRERIKRLKMKKTPKEANSDSTTTKKKKLIKPSEQKAREESGDGGLSNGAAGTPPVSPARPEVHSVDGGGLLVPFYSQFGPDSYQDSRQAGQELFKLLISPFPVDDFFE